LVDAQLPPALARWLREAGHEAQHVDELGWRDASDELIWTHALQLDAVIVTKDEDFAVRSAQADVAPVIVWLRVGNTTNPALRAWIELRLSDIVVLLTQGSRLVEVV
jgi:predicted nuclease of predicted toxin-antitoxin system